MPELEGDEYTLGDLAEFFELFKSVGVSKEAMLYAIGMVWHE